MSFQRRWDGAAWQAYALRLVQLRHGAYNVQQIPDKVRGDCGVEFFSLDGCLYQCYAPEEVFDLPKAVSGMKAKARRDLGKLKKYTEALGEILQSMKVSRWILLCPFLDDKEVVAYVRAQGEQTLKLGLPFLETDFEALVHSADDFETQIEMLRMQSLGPPLQVLPPDDVEVLNAAGGELGVRLGQKLKRAFPSHTKVDRQKRAEEYLRALILRENTMDALRLDHPVLWERSASCLESEERRLGALGPGEGRPSVQLRESMSRIESSLRQDLSGVSAATITAMSIGTIGDWLVRCPLDFTDEEGK